MSVFDGLPDAFTAAFGEPITYSTMAGLSAEISGIWIDPSSVMLDGEFGAGVQTIRPELHASAADLPAGYGEGDTIVRAGMAWRIAAPPQPDGKGMVRLTLERIG